MIRSRMFALLVSAHVGLACATVDEPEPRKPYVFAWPFVDSERMEPRGGTSQGAEVELALAPSDAWRRLQQPALGPQERDRAAILAMAGSYRASFDFLETVLFEPGAEPARPYRSWGTERVYVVADRPDFVSLQHVMVMFAVDDEGSVQGPFVQKHWRQDWQYQPEALLEYRGFQRWRARTVPAAERRGVWSQTVYQVDDAPRYASLGGWRHDGQASVWEGGEAWRPLPRREHTVREDYQVLAGRNRHTVLPTGWVHEQDNAKLVVGEGTRRVVGRRAREVGVNRYDLVSGFDFSAGDAYWSATGEFWGLVRAGWAARAAGGSEFHAARQCDGEPAYVPFFRAANRLSEGGALSREAQQAEVERILDCLVGPV